MKGTNLGLFLPHDSIAGNLTVGSKNLTSTVGKVYLIPLVVPIGSSRTEIFSSCNVLA